MERRRHRLFILKASYYMFPIYIVPVVCVYAGNSKWRGEGERVSATPCSGRSSMLITTVKPPSHRNDNARPRGSGAARRHALSCVSFLFKSGFIEACMLQARSFNCSSSPNSTERDVCLYSTTSFDVTSHRPTGL